MAPSFALEPSEQLLSEDDRQKISQSVMDRATSGLIEGRLVSITALKGALRPLSPGVNNSLGLER
jgi:hypothetical protein